MDIGGFVTGLDAQINAAAASLGAPLEGVLRLTLASAVGGLVGVERELRGREAGFRTNLLVCLGSALVMLVSTGFAFRTWPQQPGVNLNIDPARIAYGIMTGVGFLGAGAIIRHNGAVRGLTTAAGLWCVASVGMAVGFGMYLLAIVATGQVMLALWFLGLIERKLPRVRYFIVTIRRTWQPGVIHQTVERLHRTSLLVTVESFTRTGDLKAVDVAIRVAVTDPRQYVALEHELEAEPDYVLLSMREM
jgi:putative Mg2+ transporter-C (MgtC) family protein